MNQKVFRCLGFVIISCSIIFVTYRVWDIFPEIEIQVIQPNILPNLFLITILYTIAVFCVSLGWQKFLVNQGEPLATFSLCQKIYSRSVIAKYVPLGILEYAGRHVIAGEHGISQGHVASANLWEILSQVFVACIFISVFWFLSGTELQIISSAFLFTVFLGFFVVLISFNKFVNLIPWLVNRFNISRLKLKFVIVPMIFYTVFFFILGVILVVVVSNVSQQLNLHETAYIFAISAIAWLFGYITPGAPAGLGIREATLLLGIGEMVSEPNALLIIGLFRIVTVLGDLLYFTFGCFLSHHKNP